MIQNEKDILKKTNYYFIFFWFFFIFFIICAYFAEFLIGEKTLQRVALYAFVAFVPYFIDLYLYNKSNGYSKVIINYGMIGYCLFYSLCLFTATKPIVTVYFIPLLIYLILYENRTLLIIICAAYLMINVIAILIWVTVNHQFNSYYLAQYEIQLALCIFASVVSLIFSKLLKEFNDFRKGVIHTQAEEAENNAKRLSNASVGIATHITDIKHSIDSNNSNVASVNRSLSEVNSGMMSVSESLGQQTIATTKIQSEVDEIVTIAKSLVTTANESK